ncbi:MAG: hypothetical protein U9Q76_04020, partial [candidate division WOR-3 bacterium]|nr:hypothetical protein [candidate division WOR-3 bacterium]
HDLAKIWNLDVDKGLGCVGVIDLERLVHFVEEHRRAIMIQKNHIGIIVLRLYFKAKFVTVEADSRIHIGYVELDNAVYCDPLGLDTVDV